MSDLDSMASPVVSRETYGIVKRSLVVRLEPLSMRTPTATTNAPEHSDTDVSRETVLEAVEEAAIVPEVDEMPITEERVQPPAVDQSDEASAGLPTDETPIATQTATAMQVLGQVGETFPRPPRRRVVAIANQKGGVGKTTTTVNIAAAMALHGLRVLVIDLDPQGNASTALGIDHHSEMPSVYDLLIEGKSLGDVVIEVAEIPGTLMRAGDHRPRRR